LNHAQSRTGPGYSQRDAAACHTWPAEMPRGSWPAGPVQRGKWPMCRRGGTRAGRAHGAVTVHDPHARRHGGVHASGVAVPCRWQGVAGEHRGSLGEAPGRVTGM
jgi:hypothetical protein